MDHNPYHSSTWEKKSPCSVSPSSPASSPWSSLGQGSCPSAPRLSSEPEVRLCFSLVQPSQTWAHRVLVEQSWLEHLQLPYPTGDPVWAKGSSSQLGCPLFFPVPQGFLLFPVVWPARRAKGLSTYMQKSANLTSSSLYFFQMYGRLFTST